MQTQTKHVSFTQSNVDKCRCTSCPVQKDSSCVTQKVEAIRARGMTGLSDEDIPNVYCSQGTASCDDLDFSQSCACPTCAVWQENGLGNYKYCQNGDAEKMG